MLQADARIMGEAPAAGEISGATTGLVVRYIRETLGEAATGELIELARSQKSVEQLSETTTWSSLDEWLGLLDAAERLTGDPDVGIPIGAQLLAQYSGTEVAALLRSLGSPGEVLRNVASTAAKYTTISVMEALEVEETRALICARNTNGQRRTRQSCNVTIGVLTQAPPLFGMAPAHVEQLECEAEGDDKCLYRVTWDPTTATSDAARRVEHLERELAALTSRFETLQSTAAELVSADDVETVLAGITRRAGLAVRAPRYLLAVRVTPNAEMRVHHSGLADDEVRRLVTALEDGTLADEEGARLIAAVESSRHRYGHLVAFYPGTGEFFTQERQLLDAYARHAAAALDTAAALAEARQLFAANPQPMWVFDADTLAFLEVNEAAVRHYGYSRSEFLARRVTDIRPSADPTALLAREETDEQGQRVSQAAGRHQLKDGRVISVEVRRHELIFEGRPAVLVAIEDVTQRNALEEELEHQAFHDSLTNLANRALFNDRVQHALQRLARESSSVAVLLLDLDAFKTVNDSVGHTAGDELLITVSQRLRDVLRPSDTAARLGGDEFAILLEGLAGIDEAREITQRVMDTFETPFFIGGTEAAVRASIGVTVVSDGRVDAEGLLRNADAAMYSAKNHGKGCYRVFEPSMHSEAVARLELASDLRHSIVGDEFILHYQPVVSLSAGQVVALEALVRWQHPRRGLLMPMEFIPLAEDNGLIVDLGRWVLTQACRQARVWQLAHPELSLTIAVNVSPRQLAEPGLVDDVCRILTDTGLNPGSLTLEITESILIAEPEAAIARLTELKATGVRLAIDDFGVGYSSLGALKSLPVDVLKIDKAFIDGVTIGAEADALIQAILRLAHTFNLLTVAEGVEHPYQLKRLEELGCDQIQGFCFSHPIPAPAIDHLLAQQVRDESHRGLAISEGPGRDLGR